MPVQITYMGTKKGLAPFVAQVIQQAQPGVMLDAFAGMCTVGEAVAPKRQVWSNDIQVFASDVGRALFTSSDEPPGVVQAAHVYFERFERHRECLSSLLPRSLQAEKHLFESETYSSFLKRSAALDKSLALERPNLFRRQHHLFTSIYSSSYFGINQAIEADSIIHSVSHAYGTRRISLDLKRWLLIALGRSFLKVANSTGHFAEFLRPKQASYERFLRQRRRSVWREWLFSIGELFPSGSADWRKKNRCFNEDSLSLLPRLVRTKNRPAVIYADPPYTDDQYSRYYHLLDTLMLYDYPAVTGKGLYRRGRPHTSFSLKSEAVAAFAKLIATAAKIEADLVLSYPSNGLIHEAGFDPKQLLHKHFRKVDRCFALPHSHSTFGASKGAAKANVTEVIYFAQP